MSDPVIRTEQLTKVYGGPPPAAQGGGARPSPGTPPPAGHAGGLVAVDHLDLAVERGEVFALLGPNGAGKTTTIGMLTTRVVPTSGRATVAGVDVITSPATVKQVIGVVSQTNTLDRSLTVAQNLYFHGRYFGMGLREAREESDRLLELFRLTDKVDADVSQLSGGLAQRLMVARSIMHRPQVLFLDEPTTGLDPQSRLALWDVIRELNGRGQTILLTTHYMEEADRLADRVAIMDHGRILALDTPSRLKQSVDADTVVTLTADGDLTRLTEALRGMDHVNRVQQEDEAEGGQALLVFVRGTDGILPRIIATAEQCQVRVRDVSIDVPSLETVFINLTGRELRE